MAKFRIYCDVTRASGFQTWIADAETAEEAREKFDRGEIKLEGEEIEITETTVCEVTELEENPTTTTAGS